MYQFIFQNATVGTMIIQVMAKDNDIGPNAAVKYRFKPDPLGSFRSFSIDEDTGSITLKLPLDRERQKVHELRVEAYDQGIPTPLSSDLDLAIYVRNVNDYEPQFLVEEITVNFTEHARPGLERRQLPDTIDRDEVDDLDDPPTTVCYFIVHGNENGHFKLDPHSHILTVSSWVSLFLSHLLINYMAKKLCGHPSVPLFVETNRILSAKWNIVNRLFLSTNSV